MQVGGGGGDKFQGGEKMSGKEHRLDCTLHCTKRRNARGRKRENEGEGERKMESESREKEGE